MVERKSETFHLLLLQWLSGCGTDSIQHSQVKGSLKDDLWRGSDTIALKLSRTIHFLLPF